MKWSWFNQHEGNCWDETFSNPYEALEAMAKRQGESIDTIASSMARIGLFLAQVRVTVEPLMVLRPHTKESRDEQ